MGNQQKFDPFEYYDATTYRSASLWTRDAMLTAIRAILLDNNLDMDARFEAMSDKELRHFFEGSGKIPYRSEEILRPYKFEILRFAKN